MTIVPTNAVDVRQLVPTDDRSAFVRAAAVQATAFMASHRWWPGSRRMFFAAALAPVAASFLVQLEAAVGAEQDEWIWVVTGSVPGAWFVPDRVHEADDALRIYCELARAWLQAFAQGDRSAKVFPFRHPRTTAARSKWTADLTRIESALAKPIGHDREAWIDATHCATRPLDVLQTTSTSRLVVGQLALDHRGEPGILLHQTARPPADWLAIQRDARFRELAAGTWWKLAPLSGGSLQIPEALLTPCGEPSKADVETAMQHANEFGKQGLREALAARRAP